MLDQLINAQQTQTHHTHAKHMATQRTSHRSIKCEEQKKKPAIINNTMPRTLIYTYIVFVLL